MKSEGLTLTLKSQISQTKAFEVPVINLSYWQVSFKCTTCTMYVLNDAVDEYLFQILL